MLKGYKQLLNAVIERHEVTEKEAEFILDHAFFDYDVIDLILNDEIYNYFNYLPDMYL